MSDDYNAIITAEDANAVINDKLKKTFDGRIVRKDLTKKIKEGANVAFLFIIRIIGVLILLIIGLLSSLGEPIPNIV